MESSDDFDAPVSKKPKKSNEAPPAESADSTQIMAENSSSSTSSIVTTFFRRLREINSHGQANAVNQIRDLVLNDNDLLIKIKNEIIPYLIESMKTKDLKAAWILANLATADFQLAKIIIDGGALLILIEWLGSPNFDEANQAILAIKTIVDAYEGSNEIKAMIVMQHIHSLALTIEHSDNKIQANAIYVFQNIMSANMLHIEKIIESGAVVLLIKFLSPQYINILESVLWALRSFLTHGTYTCAYCYQNGILEPLAALLTKTVAPNLLFPVVSTINTFCQNYCSKLYPEESMQLFGRLIPLVSNSDVKILVRVLQAISCFNAQQVNDFPNREYVHERFICLIKMQEVFVQSAAMQAFGCIINWCYHKMTVPMIQNSVTTMTLFLQQHDHAIQEKALCFLIKVAEDPDKIEWIISANLIQDIIRLFSSHGMVAANIVKSITGGTKDQLNVVVRANCISPLIHLSTSVILDARIAALGALANITSHYRDACLHLNIVNSLRSVWSKDKSANLMKEFSRVFFNLLQDPLPLSIIVFPLLPYLFYFVHHAETIDDILFSLKTLSSATRSFPDAVQIYINKEVVSRLMGLLKHQNENVKKAALNVFDSICGAKRRRHLIKDCDVLKQITLLLKHPNENINLNGLSVLSKLAAGTVREIQAILDEENLILLASSFLKNKSLAVKQETIKFFSTMAKNASVQQLMAIFNTDLLTSWFEFMKQDNSDAGILILMLQTFLDICKKLENSESNLVEFRQRFFASNGQLALYKLYSNGNKQIGAIIYGCISALNIPLSSVTNIPKIT